MLPSHHHKKAIALALTLGAILPSTAAAERPMDSGGASVSIPQTPVVRVTTSSGGFDWGDAGIGAAGVVAVAMLGLGGGLVISHHRPPRNRHTTGLPN